MTALAGTNPSGYGYFVDSTRNHFLVFSRRAPVLQHTMFTRVPLWIVHWFADPRFVGLSQGTQSVDMRGRHVREGSLLHGPLVDAPTGDADVKHPTRMLMETRLPMTVFLNRPDMSTPIRLASAARCLGHEATVQHS